ncbi:hypothetical protein EBQ91_01090 [bacterium]|nr:hypothetical protein [bacterium]
MYACPPEAADNHDIWITIGQSLHSLDESLLEHWDNWSKLSSKYKEGSAIKDGSLLVKRVEEELEALFM